MAFELTLIRHGQSSNNALPEPERVEDPGLTSLGFSQAESLARRFDKDHFDVVLTSGFRRALETTRPLAKAVDLQPRIWTDLHEVGGCYAGFVSGKEVGRPGMNRQQLSDEFAEFVIPDDIQDQGWWASRPYESWEQAVVRGKRKRDRLLAEFLHTSKSVACVIHADFKSILLELLSPESRDLSQPHQLRNTGVSHLVIREQAVEVVTLNDISHLDADR